MKKISIYILSVLLVEAAGFSVGMLTRGGTQIYAETINKPFLSPPGIAFPIAWTILYALMGISIARIITSQRSKEKTYGIALFVLQLVLNLAWCFIFFGARQFSAALAELFLMLVSVIAMTLVFKKIDKPAAYMQIPYIAWLFFAAYLNAGVVWLN